MSVLVDTELTGLAVIDTARALYERGWMEGTAGNVSLRVPGAPSLAVISASGVSKGSLTLDDIVPVEADTGRSTRPSGPRPSAETAIHAALYRLQPGCGAVVHAHPPYATALSARAARTGRRSIRFADFEIIKGLGTADPFQVEVPVLPNWPDVSEIAADTARLLAAPGSDLPPVLLIAHHGATAFGPDLETARNRLECLEMLCQLTLIT